MDWIERLNRSVGPLAFGSGAVELLGWAYSSALPDNMPHRHTFFEVCMVGNHGEGRFIAGRQSASIQAGMIFFARPGVVHQIVNTDPQPMELYWVSFQWNGVPGDGDELARLMNFFQDSSILSIPDDAGRLQSLWSALRTIAGGKEYQGLGSQISALTVSLLLSIAQSGSGAEVNALPASDNSQHTARLAAQYIYDNLARPLSVQEIADQVYVSARHLTRLFRQFTAKSPMDYVQTMRMESAASLLEGSGMPIKEIATMTGYGDVHYFTRIFTRYFARPPGAYRSELDISIGEKTDTVIPDIDPESE